MSDPKAVGQYRNAYFLQPEGANWSKNYVSPWEYVTSHGEYDFYVNRKRKTIGVQYGPHTGQYFHVEQEDIKNMHDTDLRALILVIGMTILVW